MTKNKQIDVTQMQKTIEEAERIVSGIQDANLKPIAFREVLNVLLGGSSVVVRKRRKGSKKERVSQEGNETRKPPKKEGGLKWLKELVNEGFFANLKSTKEIRARLAEKGHHCKSSDLTWPLLELTKENILQRKKHVPQGGKKAVWHYSNYEG